MFEAVVSPLQVLVTAAGAFALGRWCRGGRWSFPHAAIAGAADTALGLLLVSFTIFLAVVCDLAAPWFFWSLLLLLGLAGIWEARRARKEGVGLSRFRGWPLGAGLIFAAGVFWLALAPPAAVDELVYHLAVPRQMLRAGGSVFFKDNIYAYFPQSCEMLFLFGLGIGGELAAKLFHSLFGALLSLALYGFTRQRLPKGSSLGAVALFLTIPSVIWVAPLAYVDLAFACYGFLALAFVLEGIRRDQLGLAVAAGLMAGAAWSVKYTGLQWTMLLGLVILLESLFARRNRIPWSAVGVGAVACLVASPWLVRNWIVTGWPLYPFGVGWFTLNPAMNWDPERSRLFLIWLSGFGGGLETSVWGKVLAPLLVFFQARFKDPMAYDGVIGPVFLMIPFLLVGRVGRKADFREIRILVCFSLACLYYWSLTTQQVRFLLPVAPVLAYLLVRGLSTRKSVAWRALAAFLVLVGLAMGGREAVHANPYPWRPGADREEYQASRVFGYRLYQEVNRTLREGDLLYLVNMGNYGYLLDHRWRSDFVFEYYRLGAVLEKATSAAEVARFFREQGVTHLMINETVTLSPLALDEGQRELLARFLKTRASLLARDPASPGASLWRIDQPR